ncbi:hypothetical protein BO94DRAFT_515153 [Aspergillus sclerotioniger CBS 115572]|uniref:Uncharacterized protein n=1 Tax=Aspergillus sclerotioniger CBS 115572 TaxID=1450535 RepID=A0A317WWR3_9EURO|nr:hypothetical protein BO94DRAFT_515153 [Aspergillus sclerotioniger CBS 115572]PWY89627.1 hypothetical protein BO94DRAFT_515153 [Aspergillus sclerotioniger CBS 115572]
MMESILEMFGSGPIPTLLTILITVIPSASSIWTDRTARQAAAAKKKAAEASRIASEKTAQAQDAIYEEAIRNMAGNEYREICIPSNGFNAGPAFTISLAACILVGIKLTERVGKDLQIIGLRLSEIRNELGQQTTAMIQGWQTHGFGAFIYWFLDNEIRDAGGEASVGCHAFYVYNPTTSANVVFKNLLRENPLPASFAGICSDIEAVFLLMWQNRQTLFQTDPQKAKNMQFHLLVPAKRSFAIFERMVIDKGVGKLIIKGHTDEGTCYAWFNFVRVPRHVVLQDVGNLDTDHADRERSDRRFIWSWSTGVGFWFAGFISTFVFPPAGPYCAAGFMGSWASAAKYGPVDDVLQSFRSAPRVLGPPANVTNPSGA